MKRFISAAIVSAAFLAFAAPANATRLPDQGETSATPVVKERLRPAAKDYRVHIVLCGQYRTMHAKHVIKGIIAPLNMITLKVRNKCFRGFRPSDRVVDIKSGYLNGYWGGTSRNPNMCSIGLDTSLGSDPYVPRHEFLHCLGMLHHTSPGGTMSLPTPSMQPISEEEWDALRLAYTFCYKPCGLR